MNRVLMFLVIWLIVYLFYFLFVIIRRKKIELFKNNSHVKYLVNVYKIDIDKINIKKLANIIAIANGFIISLTMIIIDFIKNIYLKLFVALILLVILQLVVYYIIGRLLKRKYWLISVFFLTKNSIFKC